MKVNIGHKVKSNTGNRIFYPNPVVSSFGLSGRLESNECIRQAPWLLTHSTGKRRRYKDKSDAHSLTFFHAF